MAITKPSDGGPTRPVLLVGAGLAAGAAGAKAPALLKGLPDVAVVGSGAFGGWTALALRERGAKVTLIDAYGRGNPRAFSGDKSRLSRLSYGNREIYTRWAARTATIKGNAA